MSWAWLTSAWTPCPTNILTPLAMRRSPAQSRRSPSSKDRPMTLSDDRTRDPDAFARNFDHTSPEYARDPATALRRLREQCPIARSGTNGGFYIATRYDEVAAIAR